MASERSEHYLKTELYDLGRSDPRIFDFLESGALDGLWYWDLENPGEGWMSPRAKKLFGYEESEVPNTSDWWRGAIHPDDLQTARRNLELYYADPSRTFDQVVRYRHQDGSTVWVRCRAIGIRNKEGKITRLLGAYRDVTSLKRTELNLRNQGRELSAALDDLRAVNKELDAFVYVASHDLQEPLRNLTAFSTFLRQDLGDDLPERAAEDLRFITDAAERMRTLVQDLLELSRVGRANLRPERVRLDDCVDDSLAALCVRLQESQARIERDPLPEVTGDRTALTQVYQNLISNAMKFVVGEMPEIALTAEQQDGDWILGVKDNGIGLKPEYAKQIFAPFRRLHGASEYEGSGIGLAICRKAVERHGGRIWVESEPGRGSHFRFTLPAVADARAPLPDHFPDSDGRTPDAEAPTRGTG